MKKKHLVMLSLAMMLMVGCSKSSNDGDIKKDTVTEVPTLQEEATSTPEVTQEVDETITIKQIPPMDFVKDLKLGWNLGNTLDAKGSMGIGSENAWGNPTTTKEMIVAVKDAGFNVIRIPVTWDSHMLTSGDYMIHDKWLERVKEVVDYAYEEGMYVIINMHHEEWLFPSYDNQEAAASRLKAAWTQIANYFKEYDERLIFEGMNEPRMTGTPNEWNGGNQEGWDVINYLDKTFVESVRATGGNNRYRQLMVPGYAASSSTNALKAIQLPEHDHIIVSVHAYLPYMMALEGGNTTSFDATNENDTRDIDNLMKSLNELFISKGIPVIIGEFGSRNKENLADRVELAEYYVKAAHQYNIPCIWWDNNVFTGSGEQFGLYDRRANQWIYPEIVEALLKGIE